MSVTVGEGTVRIGIKYRYTLGSTITPRACARGKAILLTAPTPRADMTQLRMLDLDAGKDRQVMK